MDLPDAGRRAAAFAWTEEIELVKKELALQ